MEGCVRGDPGCSSRPHRPQQHAGGGPRSEGGREGVAALCSHARDEQLLVGVCGGRYGESEQPDKGRRAGEEERGFFEGFFWYLLMHPLHWHLGREGR